MALAFKARAESLCKLITKVNNNAICDRFVKSCKICYNQTGLIFYIKIVGGMQHGANIFNGKTRWCST